MTKGPLFCLILLLFQITVAAQSTPLTGLVTNEKEEILIGASVYWKDTRVGTVTDTSGRFQLSARNSEAVLVVEYVGHTPAEVTVLPGENKLWIEVSGVKQLKEVTVSEKAFDNRVSLLETRNIESISSKELRKAPCCNLSESFQTNGAVDVTFPNALTGVKEIQLLGLRGIYSQFLVENRPTMSGIATPFAFEYIPGTWLNGISLAKGASSVKNGNTGITGQISADLVKPYSDHPLFFNLFTSTEGRGEVNLHLNRKGKGYFSNGVYLHASGVRNNWDMNGDKFKDSPNRSQLNGMYRVMYESPVGCAQFNVHVVSDRRNGGQFRDIPGYTGRFIVDQNNDRVEVWGKYGKEQLFGRRFLELGNMIAASWHRTDALFGRNRYNAEQRSFYWQTLLQNIIGTTDHKIVVAPSIQYDDIREFVNEGDNSRREFVPGAMAEYTWSRSSLRMETPDLVLVAGARYDWNSRFGSQFTPRMSAKYHLDKNSVLRVSAGRGFRSPNLTAENISLLASNRRFDFAPDLGVEEAWNYGVNYTRDFKIGGKSANLSLDVYRTDFIRQTLVDVERDPTVVYFYNLDGRSFSNSVLANFQYNLLKGLDVKLAFKVNDVRSTFSDDQLKTVPLVARYRGLVTVDYTTPNKKWTFNSHAQIIGTQRLPDNSKLPFLLTQDFPPLTPTYALFNAQATRVFNERFEIYFGGENLGGFRQHHVLIDPNNPESLYFNASQVWAPMMGQIVYAGLRFTLKDRISKPLFKKGESITESFKVLGNCGMCKTRIEQAAMAVEGVKIALWDDQTGMFTVTFDPSQTSLDALHLKIASVGHDTEKVKAKDEVYEALHACCKYDRQ